MVLLLCLSHQSSAQSGREILVNSIAFHDPDQNWSEFSGTLKLEETRPNAPSRFTTLVFANGRNELTIKRKEWAVMVQGNRAEVLQGKIKEEVAIRTRDYYQYLYGLPMKLASSYARISSSPRKITFLDQLVWKVDIVYPSDTWSFYIDPQNFQLMGYRFIKKDGSGETIHLDGLSQVGRMQLPKSRTWYTLDGELLGTDIIRQTTKP